MKHEVKLKATMPLCKHWDSPQRECSGFKYDCRFYDAEDDWFCQCKHCAYEKEVFQIIQTNSIVFEREFAKTYDEVQTLKIGRKDYSDANIEYLEVDGTVLIDETKS